VAAALAAKFPNVAVAESNQAVLDGSDVVMLAIRPQVTVEVLSDLEFRPDPASKVVRAIPMPMVAKLCGRPAAQPTPSYNGPRSSPLA
jgi:pyrroline-5-carboxylate reductase